MGRLVTNLFSEGEVDKGWPAKDHDPEPGVGLQSSSNGFPHPPYLFKDCEVIDTYVTYQDQYEAVSSEMVG